MMKESFSQNEIKKFNLSNLTRAIRKVVSIPYQELQRELKEYVFPRLDFMVGNGKRPRFFVFEEHYVETEWKDMISTHYINTSYEVKNTVMRIHFFVDTKLDADSYRGCFTLRSINETQIMLSYIYPNWKWLRYWDKPVNVMTYKKKVHINGVEIVFRTYPLFVQDNVVVACAQACLISMSKYLHSQYDYNKIRIGNINDSYHSNKTKIYPSQGLLPTQMLEILYNHNIPSGFQVYKNNPEEFREYIDYCVESAIPVLAGLYIVSENRVERHVIQIIGHTDVLEGKKYVVYDDSGYYLKQLGNEGFVGCVDWDTFCEGLAEDISFIIYPIHEKVYILYDNFRRHMNDMLEKLNMSEALEVEDGQKDKRILLVDNREVKKFLYENMVCNEAVIQDIRTEAMRLLQIDMPHYLWCCEYRTSEGNMLFIADPTYNRRTTKNIFLNKVPLISESQIGLLKYE